MCKYSVCLLPASSALTNERVSQSDKTLLPAGQRSEVVSEQIRWGKKGHRGGESREEEVVEVKRPGRVCSLTAVCHMGQQDESRIIFKHVYIKYDIIGAYTQVLYLSTTSLYSSIPLHLVTSHVKILLKIAISSSNKEIFPLLTSHMVLNSCSRPKRGKKSGAGRKGDG